MKTTDKIYWMALVLQRNRHGHCFEMHNEMFECCQRQWQWWRGYSCNYIMTKSSTSTDENKLCRLNNMQSALSSPPIPSPIEQIRRQCILSTQDQFKMFTIIYERSLYLLCIKAGHHAFIWKHLLQWSYFHAVSVKQKK